ncbi:MAG: MFS transporter [Acidobacteriota bacterium]
MKRRNVVLLFLVLLSAIAFLDRLCIAVAGPRMQNDLGISPTEWGWILGAFAIAYGLFEIPSGALGDRVGYNKVLTRIALWWGAFTSFTGLATSFPSLLGTQFLFGAGEAGAYPNMAGTIRRWFPTNKRANAQGFVWAASRIGGALAPLILVPIQAAWGWRASFWMLGVIGFIWAACWARWYRDPAPEDFELDPDPPPEARPGLKVDGHTGVPWRKLFGSRQIWWIAAMYWCYAWGSWFYFSWFPTYLVRGRNLTVGQMGAFSAFPFLLGAAGNLLGGRTGDSLSQKYGLKIGRRLIGTSALFVAGILILSTGLTHGKAIGVILLSVAFGVMDFMLPSAWAVCLDVGGQYAATVSGIMNTAGLFGGFVCTVLFGYDVKVSGNYNFPLIVIGAMVLVSSVLFLKIDPTRPVVPGSGA